MVYVQTNCQRDNMCPIGYGCNNTVCIQFYTLKIGEYAQNHNFCITNYTYKGKCDAVVAYIGTTKAPSSLVCNINDTCMYYTVNDNILIQQAPCMCSGIKGSKTGYCGLYANVSEIVEQFYKALVYSDSICSGNFSHSTNPDILYVCGSITLKQYNYGQIMLNRYTYYNLFMSGAIDHCARPLGLFDPWYDSTKYSSAINAGIEFILFLFCVF